MTKFMATFVAVILYTTSSLANEIKICYSFDSGLNLERRAITASEVIQTCRLLRNPYLKHSDRQILEEFAQVQNICQNR